jgi:hypothetical protein
MIGRLMTLVALCITAAGCGEGESKSPSTEAATAQTTATDDQAAEEKEQEVSTPDIELDDAAAEGDLEAIRQHIAAGSDVDKDTPLVTATVFGNIEAAKLLIEAGADLNAQDTQGSTPVFVAAFFCRPDILKLLLEKGADQSIPNKEGRTPSEVVQAPFALVKPAYEYIERQLAPKGLRLDHERLKKVRPMMVEILNAAEK